MKSILYKWVIFAIFSFATLIAYADETDELVIIVHPSNPLTMISADEVKKIYLLKKKFFKSGNKVIPGDQPKGTKSYNLFYRDIIAMPHIKLKSYWHRLIFAGKGTPPKIIGFDRIVKEWVATQPQAIGYIMRSEIDGTIKVLDLN